MGSQTEVKTIKAAKKSHVCEWCGDLIKPGETYKRWRFYDGHDAGTVKIHPECYDAFQDLDWVDGNQWYPYENRRGCNCFTERGCQRCITNGTLKE